MVDCEGNLQLSAPGELGFASGLLSRTSLPARLFSRRSNIASMTGGC